jgi:hypothetical protein
MSWIRHWSGQLAARKQAVTAARQQEAAETAESAAAAAAAPAAAAAEAAQRLARGRRAVAYLDRQVSQKQRRELAARLQDMEVLSALLVLESSNKRHLRYEAKA